MPAPEQFSRSLYSLLRHSGYLRYYSCLCLSTSTNSTNRTTLDLNQLHQQEGEQENLKPLWQQSDLRLVTQLRRLSSETIPVSPQRPLPALPPKEFTALPAKTGNPSLPVTQGKLRMPARPRPPYILLQQSNTRTSPAFQLPLGVSRIKEKTLSKNQCAR